MNYSILIMSYLVGAIPFAFIITRLITGEDVRKHGSGNVGATNATRVMGLKFGVLVALLDVLKGFTAVLLAEFFLPAGAPAFIILIAGLMAIIGHNWSIFLRFSGGKGVAATFGVLLKLLPVIFIIYAVLWLLIVILTRYVSLGSILGALSLPILTFYFKGDFFYLVFAIVLTLFIILRHHTNIRRLFNGTERRMKWSVGGNRG